MAIIVFLLTLAGAAPAASVNTSDDVRTLVAEIERLHPNPYHAVSRADFRKAAAELAARAPSLSREQALVATMRLVALLGEREGHSGVAPVYGGHRIPLHAFPWRFWRFPDGYYVTAAVDASLVGARLVAVAGTPVADVEAKLRPLVTRDNESSLGFGLPYYLVSAEVLRGLELTPSLETATFTVVTRAGATREVTLRALTVPGYQRVLPSRPSSRRHRGSRASAGRCTSG